MVPVVQSSSRCLKVSRENKNRNRHRNRMRIRIRIISTNHPNHLTHLATTTNLTNQKYLTPLPKYPQLILIPKCMSHDPQYDPIWPFLFSPGEINSNWESTQTKEPRFAVIKLAKKYHKGTLYIFTTRWRPWANIKINRKMDSSWHSTKSRWSNKKIRKYWRITKNKN